MSNNKTIYSNNKDQDLTKNLNSQNIDLSILKPASDQETQQVPVTNVADPALPQQNANQQVLPKSQNSLDLEKKGKDADEFLLPRCEFKWRFEETSYFLMNEMKFWNTYHRSQGTRFFKKYGNQTEYFDKELTRAKKKGDNSYYSHTGGYFNPYSFKQYKDKINFKTHIDRSNLNLYDRILEYKHLMCEEVLKEFNTKIGVMNNIHQNGQRRTRPIVYHENEYPCVMVGMYFWTPTPKSTKSQYKNEKHLQQLAMAYFVGIMNDAANSDGIPIELVIRSSFGHNNPSLSETDNSFRINIGIVPVEYARLLGRGLALLYKLLKILHDGASRHISLNPNHHLHAQAKKYNIFKKEEAEKKLKKSSPKEVILANTYWKSLFCNANSKGGQLIGEFFRETYYVDCFADYVMDFVHVEGFFANPLVAEKPIEAMFNHLVYGEKVSLIKGVTEALNQRKKSSWTREEKKSIQDDQAFWEIIQDLADGLGDKAPKKTLVGLYKFLEQANIRFITDCYYDPESETVSGFGSDSDVEVKPSFNDKDIFAKKLTFSTGMMAINVAYYLATIHCQKTVGAHTDNMYFETNDCLKFSKTPPNIKGSEILFFDLNDSNGKNVQTQKLEYELKLTNPRVVILDYASSTSKKVQGGIATVLQVLQKDSPLILLVSTGLKNEQGGSDDNPYGTLRIVTLDKKLRDDHYNHLIKKLDAHYTLSAKAHKIRKAYKARQFVPTNKQFLEDPDGKMEKQRLANELQDLGLEDKKNSPEDNQDSFAEMFKNLSISKHRTVSEERKTTDNVENKNKTFTKDTETEDNSKSRYHWNTNDREVIFKVAEVDGSHGDCAFIALGTDRNQAIALLQSHTHEKLVQDLIKPDLLSRLMDQTDTEALPPQLVEFRARFRDCYNSLVGKLEEIRASVNKAQGLTGESGLKLEEVADCIHDDTFACQYRTDLAQLKDIESDRERFSPTKEQVDIFLQHEFIERRAFLSYQYGRGGTLEALARIMKKGVTILTGERDLQRTLGVDAPEGVSDRVYLHHTGGEDSKGRILLNHFNILIIVSDSFLAGVCDNCMARYLKGLNFGPKVSAFRKKCLLRPSSTNNFS